MTTPRGFRDRADDSLFTLIGEIPELIRNLVIAEVDAGKAWVRRTSKDAGIGAVWFAVAFFFLFWAVGVLVAFAIIGLAVVDAGMALSARGVRRAAARRRRCSCCSASSGSARSRTAQNPVQSIVQDVKEVRDEF